MGYFDYIEGIFNSNIVDRYLICTFSFLEYLNRIKGILQENTKMKIGLCTTA